MTSVPHGSDILACARGELDSTRWPRLRLDLLQVLVTRRFGWPESLVARLGAAVDELCAPIDARDVAALRLRIDPLLRDLRTQLDREAEARPAGGGHVTAERESALEIRVARWPGAVRHAE